MALKPNRYEAATDISYFMNTTGNRGLLVVHDTGGSGAAMDQANAVVATVTGASTSSASISGYHPVGLLLNDVVNLDLTRQHLNQHRDEVQLGSKVTLLRQGWVVTNLIDGTPTVGQPAYFNANGALTPTNPGAVDTHIPTSTDWPNAVGRFLSIKDGDGYAKVEINITG